MNQENVEYFKRKIKRTYKRYIGERTDKNASLTDVAKLFNIPIDEKRIGDYVIKQIDYNTPSIEIIDKKNNTSYSATYTGCAELLNFDVIGGIEFNKVVKLSKEKKEESLYYIGEKTPIITRMTFSDNDYDLTFEKEMPHSINFGNDGEKFRVRYLKNMKHKNENVKQFLLTREFEKNQNLWNDNYYDSIDHFYTYGIGQHYIKQHDKQDKYCYIKNENVIYGINNFYIEDLIHYFHGICFESTNVDIIRFLPHNIELTKFPKLTNKEMKSALVFIGGTDNGIHHTFTIFKTKNPNNIIEAAAIDPGMHLKYEAIKWERFEKENGVPDHRKVVMVSKEARYPNIDIGNITSLEIINIIKELDTEFKDNMFIQFVINELKTFINKMEVQKGILKEELDPLSPKLLIDKSFEEINSLVSENQDDYFKLISEKFEELTNLSKEKSKSKVLKLGN